MQPAPRSICTRLAISTAVALVVAAVTMVSLPAQDQTTPVFRANVQTVSVYATVQNRDGRLVPDLTKEDFQILDDGKPAPVTIFSHEIVPITVALMLDMSDSMRDDYDRVRQAASHFVNVLRPEDRVRIGTFGHDVALSPYLTGDKAILHRVLREELWLSHFTALWSGLRAAMDSLDHEAGRRVVLVLTDGGDFCTLGIADIWRDFPIPVGRTMQLPATPKGLPDPSDTPPPAALPPPPPYQEFWNRFPTTGCVDKGTVKRQAQTREFLIYAVGLQAQGLSQTLVDLVDETGGAHIRVSNKNIAAGFEQIAEELHSQYVLGFSPRAADGATHKLEVKIARRGLTARARKSYVAALQ